MISDQLECDALIIGTGPVGAIYARLLLDGGLRVLMVDAGPQRSAVPGSHLRNAYVHQRNLEQYHDEVVGQLYPPSLVPVSKPLIASAHHLAPRADGDNNVNPEQHRRGNMPGAAVTYAVGGMGIVWTCLSHRLHPTLERWDFIADREWESLYGQAEELLSVSAEPFADSLRGEVILERLRAGYHGGGHLLPGPAPLAVRRRPDHPRLMRWTGSGEILGQALEHLGSERFAILPQHLVRRLRHAGGKVTCAEVRSLDPWGDKEIHAGLFIVACGGLLTPQLLWHSEILRDDGDRSPLGRYLYEHPLAFAQVALSSDLVSAIGERSGLRGEVPVPADDPPPFLCIPLEQGRPYHSLLIADTYDRRALEGRLDDRLFLNLYWYSLAAPRPENRVRFSPGRRDLHGLPKPTFHYALSPEERSRTAAMVEDLKQVAALLGDVLPTAPPQLLAAGRSMHYMGTTRMGPVDDGQHVVDPYSRVWGFSNLYAGGTGLFPGPTATNPTLTACALAVRSARGILDGTSPWR